MPSPRGVLWSTFLHPLRSLDRDLFLAGLEQSVTLARTYGTTFRSGELGFGEGRPQGREPGGGPGEPE